MSEVNKLKHVYKHRYALIIALFGLACMLAQFWFHEMRVDSAREVFIQFNATYPEQTRAFSWSFVNSWRIIDSWLIVGFLSGITTSCLIFIVIALSVNRTDGKEFIVDFLVMLSYLLAYLIFSYTFNPLILYRAENLLNAFVSAMMCGASSHLLTIHDHTRGRRRAELSKLSFSEDIGKELRLKSYELEHTERRDILNSLMLFFVSLSAGMLFATLIQYTFALPLEITFSNAFAKFSFALVVVYLLNAFGFLIGVVYQLTYEIHDIVELLRERAVELEKMRKKTEHLRPKSHVQKKIKF